MYQALPHKMRRYPQQTLLGEYFPTLPHLHPVYHTIQISLLGLLRQSHSNNVLIFLCFIIWNLRKRGEYGEDYHVFSLYYLHNMYLSGVPLPPPFSLIGRVLVYSLVVKSCQILVCQASPVT